MHNFVTIGNHVVNLANVVAFDMEGQAIRKIWYVGSPTPLEIPAPGVSATTLLQFLQARGFLA
jgi:hypothetical protein